MIVHDDQIRLTPKERRVLRRITGIDPHFIKNRATLARFTEQHLKSYRTDTPEIRLVKVLLRKYMAV